MLSTPSTPCILSSCLILCIPSRPYPLHYNSPPLHSSIPSPPIRRPTTPPQVGECSRECKTIAKAAEQILGEHDTDLAERLLKGKTSRADLQQWLCFDLSNACASPPPPLPADRPKGPGFVAIPAEEVHVVNMMGEMRAKGVRGKLVKPEDVLDRQPGTRD